MEDILIVDGYNVIHAWPEFERNRESDLDHARHRLVSILANYRAVTGLRILVVFDAYRLKGTVSRVDIVDGVEVIYTREGETADGFIERHAGELAKEAAVFVATSDWSEQTFIFGKGAYRLTPAELREMVRQAGQQSQQMYRQDRPGDSYLENRLPGPDRDVMEKWRRQKS